MASVALYPVTSASYLNEGAANIVYRLDIRGPTPPATLLEEYGEGTPPPTEVEFEEFEEKQTQLKVFDNKLLRLRKDLPTTAPCAVAQESWLRLIAPLIDKDQLVVQELVEIPPGFINNLNEELREWERSKRSVRLMELRPAKRHGTYLADDKHGLLVTDMSNHGITVTADQRPLDESDLGFECEEVVQFKPKWLAQSPSAPENARRCRTCALRARSNSERVLLGKSVEVYFCPLDLLSTDIRDVTRASEVLLQGSKINTFVFAHWLQQTPLLRRLREIQLQKDSNGVLLADTSDENFRVAMTLRDCTVFVRFPIRPRMIDLFEAAIKDPQIPNPNCDDLEIEARLGDLDLKSAEKAEYWKSIETALIDEGWYTGTEKEELRQPVSCSISRVDT